MRDLEAYARTEKRSRRWIEESRVPIALPSIDDLIALSQDAKRLMDTDVEPGARCCVSDVSTPSMRPERRVCSEVSASTLTES